MARIIDRNDAIGEFVPQPDDDLVICRCEEITKGEIRRAIHDGMRTMTELKRFTRAGMGLCQGGTCTKIVKGILAGELGIRPSELDEPTSRSPARPVEMRIFGNEEDDG